MKYLQFGVVEFGEEIPNHLAEQQLTLGQMLAVVVYELVLHVVPFLLLLHSLYCVGYPAGRAILYEQVVGERVELDIVSVAAVDRQYAVDGYFFQQEQRGKLR